MTSTSRAFDRGTYRADRDLREIGSEFRQRRLAFGFSQAHVAASCRMSRSRCCRVEAGRIATLSVPEVHRLAAVLGLEAVVRLYPGGNPVRDHAHATRIRSLLAHAAARSGTGRRYR
jgi:transcriptional regulator with XRE-family HTH domain